MWNQMEVFSYVIPFLLIFAVVFAILKKTKILGDDNGGILAIISVSIGLLSLQLDFVSEFFMIIFPRFGIGLSIFLVLLIFIGFFIPHGDHEGLFKKLGWVGYVIGIGAVIWAFSEWDQWGDFGGFGGWFSENIWALLILGGVIAVIVITAGKGKGKKSSGGKPDKP